MQISLQNNKINFFFSCIMLSIFCSIHSHPLKILFVLDEFPKFNQPFVLNQIVGLTRLGHDVWILADHQRFPDMIPSEVNEFRLLEKTWYKRPPPVIQKFDIICCNFGQNGCWAAKLIKERKIKGKLVTIFQGADATKLPLHKSDKQYMKLGDYNIKIHDKNMYKELFETGSLFLGVCNYFKDKIIALGAPISRTGTHYNGIDCTKFTYKKRKYIKGKPINMVTVGRLVEKKGVRFAIEAIARLIHEGHNLHFTIIGDGPDRQELEKLTKNLKIKNKVAFVGWKTQEEVVKILDNSHVFILPSVTAHSEQFLGDQEGMPTVIMEAMAMGLPVVSTYHSGIPEIVIDGVTGYLARERNVNDIVACLKKIIMNPNQWGEMGKRARRVVEENCDTSLQNEKLSSIFSSLLIHAVDNV